MPRVAAVDPGTLSFDLCVLEDGQPVAEETFDSRLVGAGEGVLLDALEAHGPYDLVYGPSGYGVPLLAAAEVGERELAEMVLVRADEARETVGIGGLRRLLRALAAGPTPVVFGPGVVHLPTVPSHRKRNRVDLGTADKVAAAAWAIADQAARRDTSVAETSMILLELGGAFTAALAIDGGRIVDGVGGSSGPPGLRSPGALDGEVAYLLAPALSKRSLFAGGALAELAGDRRDPAELWRAGEPADGWAALLEGAARTARGLLVSVRDPPEIVVSGRLSAIPGLVEAIAGALADVAPTVAVTATPVSAAARGGALIADGLAGGANAALVDSLRLREASGGVLDHLVLPGADAIRLG